MSTWPNGAPRPGQRAERSRTVRARDIELFTEITGDRNPLHIDPEFAKVGGFDTPILHGLCTYGFVGRAILQAVCGNDPANFKSFEARFSDVVYPGDTIITKLWVDGKEAIVQAETQKGNVVLAGGKATFA